jgi:glycosyltransferase involved in cell wall biosynthesis
MSNSAQKLYYIDVSPAVHRRAGIGRYAENLVRALEPQLGERLALFYNREPDAVPLAGLDHLPQRFINRANKPWRLQILLGHLLRLNFNRLIPDAALFHGTDHLLLPVREIATVLTVHDLTYRNLPQYHSRANRLYLNAAMPLYCRRADRIVVDSEHTRRDLIAAYHLPAEKIAVVYPALNSRFQPAAAAEIERVRADYHLPDRYLLFVGTIEPRKNLTRLLQAFESLYQEKLTDGLVIIGKRGWLCDEFFAALEQSPAKAAVIFPGFIADADLPALYTGAQAFAFPSLYEGFGYPPLEALACGTPVASSDSSSLPEVGGDAVLYFDPLDVASQTAALRRLLTDRDLQLDLRRRGRLQAAKFSWERTAEATLSVYQEVI